MSNESPQRVDRRARERRARGLGVAAAVAAMAAFGLTLGWPAPGISAGIGFAVYLLARRHRES